MTGGASWSFSNLAQETSFWSESLDAGTEVVRHQQIALVVDRDPVGPHHLTRAGSWFAPAMDQPIGDFGLTRREAGHCESKGCQRVNGWGHA